ncbi:hypothetical protein PIB30_078042 [Stylosanthes scabra]|uniref:Uncharacterized protein n=1 Tax=Stylosanthes scabra TaxID=79078 RepID=A0ABU6VRY6_9FABA|nr:hypothetical protein [Stylosanthes scabra]
MVGAVQPVDVRIPHQFPSHSHPPPQPPTLSCTFEKIIEGDLLRRKSHATPLYRQLTPPVPQGCSTAQLPNQCRRISTRHKFSTSVALLSCVIAPLHQSRSLSQRRHPFAQCRSPIMRHWLLRFQCSGAPFFHGIASPCLTLTQLHYSHIQNDKFS